MMKTLILLLVISVVFADYHSSRSRYDPVVRSDYGVRNSRLRLDRHDFPRVRSGGRRGGRRRDSFRDRSSRRRSHRRGGGRWRDHFD